MQTETVKIIEDMLDWLLDLRFKYYAQRQLSIPEESECRELMKIIGKAHSLVETVKHNARAKHYIED